MTWVSLTEKELAELARIADENHGGAWYVAYGKAIERSLRRKHEDQLQEADRALELSGRALRRVMNELESVYTKTPEIECQRCGRFIK